MSVGCINEARCLRANSVRGAAAGLFFASCRYFLLVFADGAGNQSMLTFISDAGVFSRRFRKKNDGSCSFRDKRWDRVQMFTVFLLIDLMGVKFGMFVP